MGKILHLTLFKKWFDDISSGKKKIEYRDIKPYWRNRLFNKEGSVKDYEEIIFTNGYGANRPRMRVEFLGVSESNGKYEIALGKVLELSKLDRR